jgi:hypothetical protein
MAFADDMKAAAGRRALGSLGEVMQTPLARAVVKYWWVSLPIGYAAYLSFQRRKAKEGKAHPIDILHDISPLICLVGTLVAVNATLQAQHAQQTADAAQAAASVKPVAAQVRDADFSVPGKG